jgi:hypothetical protein
MYSISKKKIIYFLLIVYCGIVVLQFYSITFLIYRIDNKELSFLYRDIHRAVNDIKSILLWNACYGSKYWYHTDSNYYDEKMLREMHCPESRCFITSRRDYKHYYDFDALLFHMPSKLMGIPSYRRKTQLYVFGSREPAGVLAGSVKKLNNFFNLTG